MKIDFLSDLHIDHWKEKPDDLNWKKLKNKTSDYLIILGDVSDDVDDYIKILENAKEHYKLVLFLDGNHECYNKNNKTIEQIMYELRSFSYKNKDKLFYFDGSSIIIDKIAFTGINGWWDYKGSEPDMLASEAKEIWENKYKNSKLHTGNWSIEKLAQHHFSVLKNTVSNLSKRNDIEKIVVCTHTVPIPESLFQDFNNPSWKALTSTMLNTSMKDIPSFDKNKKIKLWLHGHTHYKFDYELNDIRYITNPRGYPTERFFDWKKALQIKI